MGCGDARLAESVTPTNTVHSFDLVSQNPRVVACDVANVPLINKSVDIVVFCLALMGTNVGDFVKEAHRLLKPTGILRIAEVRSRFDDGGQGIKKVFLLFVSCD
jgi:ribosomal RNA-processing protein 8